MIMTREEKGAKRYLMRLLATEGYKKYSEILRDLDFHFTENPAKVGYMRPDTGEIVLNKNLDDKQSSVIVRHEILHNVLMHEKRLLDKLAQEHGMNPDDLSDEVKVKELDKLKRELYSNVDFNIAGDYEISNRGYTAKDKENVRAIELNGELLSGLVTEDDHPDWVNLTVEELYDKIREQRKKDEKTPTNKAETVYGVFNDNKTFLGMDGIVYGI